MVKDYNKEINKTIKNLRITYRNGSKHREGFKIDSSYYAVFTYLKNSLMKFSVGRAEAIEYYNKMIIIIGDFTNQKAYKGKLTDEDFIELFDLKHEIYRLKSEFKVKFPNRDVKLLAELITNATTAFQSLDERLEYIYNHSVNGPASRASYHRLLETGELCKAEEINEWFVGVKPVPKVIDRLRELVEDLTILKEKGTVKDIIDFKYTLRGNIETYKVLNDI